MIDACSEPLQVATRQTRLHGERELPLERRGLRLSRKKCLTTVIPSLVEPSGQRAAMRQRVTHVLQIPVLARFDEGLERTHCLFVGPNGLSC